MLGKERQKFKRSQPQTVKAKHRTNISFCWSPAHMFLIAFCRILFTYNTCTVIKVGSQVWGQTPTFIWLSSVTVGQGPFLFYLIAVGFNFTNFLTLTNIDKQVTSFVSSSPLSLSWEYRFHGPSVLGISSLWFPNLSTDSLYVDIDWVILRGSFPWMTAKANRYHDTLISFDSAYNSRGVTVFHKCYFTLNGLMECIYIAFCTHFWP